MKNEKKKERAIAPVVVTTLEEVEAFCGAPLEVNCVVRGRPFHFTGRRLKPSEAREVQLIVEQALPPVIREEGKQPVYDMDNASYRKEKEDFRRRGRALAIWFGFPCFKAQAEKEAKALVNPVEVAKWLEDRQLDEDILEGLFNALTLSQVESFLGFTSGNSFPKS